MIPCFKIERKLIMSKTKLFRNLLAHIFVKFQSEIFFSLLPSPFMFTFRFFVLSYCELECWSHSKLSILHVNFHFFVSVFWKTLQQQNITSLWKWDCRSIVRRLRKLNYFSTLIDQSIGVGYFAIDFTHHSFFFWCTVFFVRCEYLSFIYFCGTWNFLWQWHTIEHAQTRIHTHTRKKKCEKEILMKFMTSKQNPIMQHKCNYMHCIHTTLISISMTMKRLQIRPY